MDDRNRRELYDAFANADTVLLKKYVSSLDKCNIIPAAESITNIQVGTNLSLYHIDKLVFDKDENVHDKLMTVYTSLSANNDSSLVLLIRGETDHVDLYIGVVNKKLLENGTISSKGRDNLGKTIASVLEGNFPGSKLSPIDPERQKNEDGEPITDNPESIIDHCFNEVKTIAAVSGIAELRNEKEDGSEKFVQGMEKLIDSMRGQRYSAIYLADLVPPDAVDDICAEYEDIYSQLSPFKQSVRSVSENRSNTDTTSMIEGVVNTTNESTAKAVTHGKTQAISKTNTVGGGFNLGGLVGPVRIGGAIDYHHSKTDTTGKNKAKTKTKTKGTAKSLTSQNSVANAITESKGESLQITYDNRAVKTLLDHIDEQIKRLRTCEDFGLFDSCVYFISDKYESAVGAASIYKSLIRGENSSVESSAINVWKDQEKIELLSQYLKRMYHPLFAMMLQNTSDEEKRGLPVTAALMVSGKELAYQFALPKKSLIGLPVIECAEFGRNVISLDGKYSGNLGIGNIYHMHNEENTPVCLDANGLTAHTFITGSTGAGKSNAIYQILSEITTKQKNVTFMVIEPAKGEYKDVFGVNGMAEVYGTNPKLTPLLRINPFRFPETTHIYEHLDRLVEIFNVCWPMYAAMPAVLKASLEKAYEAAGWDLKKSENVSGIPIYPTFASVAREVKRYIDSSEYSDENKGNYKGSLLTRLESLTNGINGMIFTADDIEDADLFDKNVIVDLSRIGSTETKALIMGVLIMRLQEYRAGTSSKNSKLKHVTVLEEAHNLLKRTSTEQTEDGANLLGKSVEMLANSIAEMRTYGEAFIIADQAPGLLDMSVIRNTNTKIIFRLPDYSDRELVGRSANLNEEQIDELARLKRGVAAIYQNNWISPVLCQFKKYGYDENKVYIKPDMHPTSNKATVEVLNIIMKSDIRKKLDDVDYEKRIVRDVTRSDLPDFVKVSLMKYLHSAGNYNKAKEVAKIAYDFFQAEDTLKEVSDAKTIEEWQRELVDKLEPSVKSFSETEIETLVALLVHEHYLSHKEYEPIYLNYMDYIQGRRII